MATISLFWDTNMAAVTSRANALYVSFFYIRIFRFGDIQLVLTAYDAVATFITVGCGRETGLFSESIKVSQLFL